MRRRVLIGVVVVVVALASAAYASAKDQGPIRVVSESGKVGWIRGASAKAWWAGLYGGRSGTWCACMSRTNVSTFEQRYFGHARWAFHEDGSWPTGMMLIQSGHSAAWLYYPASRTTPPYLVAPGGIGSKHLRWDDWQRVTPRMQKIIEAALKHGTVSTYTGSSTYPTGWAVGGGLSGVLLVALILSAWRPTRLSGFAARLRRSRYGLSH